MAPKVSVFRKLQADPHPARGRLHRNYPPLVSRRARTAQNSRRESQDGPQKGEDSLDSDAQ